MNNWNVEFIGTAENVVKALEDYSTKLEGQVKTDYDTTLSYMKLAVNSVGTSFPIIKIRANGNSMIKDTKQSSKNFSCSVELFQTTIV